MNQATHCSGSTGNNELARTLAAYEVPPNSPLESELIARYVVASMRVPRWRPVVFIVGSFGVLAEYENQAQNH